ncbi:MAG: hypothetical protein P8179_21290 [Candidatus Thiodiazotropha sp.]
MKAKIDVKGTMTINFPAGKRTVVYGDIVEGEAKKGMSLFIPFNFSFSMTPEIESIEFVDIKIGEESYIGLVLKPEESPDEELNFYKGLNFTNEVLTIGYA